MSSIENIDNLSPEELLAPPKYDAIGVFMVFLTALIVWASSGIIIIVFSYLAIGQFSLETGASPILLAMITFFSLSLWNILSYIIRSKIFPHIYPRGRTALSQIIIMSILLYVIFAPIYLYIGWITPEKSSLLTAFSLHILINVFAFELVIGLVSQYRYFFLVLYTSIFSLLSTGCILVYIHMNTSTSQTSLFVLLALTVVAYTMNQLISALIFWGYHIFYKKTWNDPIWSLFARIESEEKSLEHEVEESLIQFTH